MRRHLIEALTFPRLVMLEQMDSGSCPLYLYYDPSYPACMICRKARECRWLRENDTFHLLAHQPLEHLHQAVRFCIDYMNAKTSADGHNARRCACESCSWLRNAVRLDRRFMGITSHSPVH